MKFFLSYVNVFQIQQNCISYGVCMGKYFYGTCKLFDDEVSYRS